MSVVGFDVGNLSCYTAVARGGGIETVANEYSDRNTLCAVSLTSRERAIGGAAKTQIISNFKNTISNFKRLIGRSFDDPFVQSEIPYLPYKLISMPDNRVGVQVQYQNEVNDFSIEQIMGMLLTKLKGIAITNVGKDVKDCVVSVPSFYTDTERRSLLKSTQIAGLNCLRVFNDTTAVALAYGIYKQDLPAPEEAPRNVVFVDIGHSAMQVAAVSFNKGKLKVISTAFDSFLGGRNFDRMMADHFTKEFKEKYKIDVTTNKRAGLRLMTECEKLKKQLSSNQGRMTLNIECLMNDIDVRSAMTRAEFEELCSSLFDRVAATLKKSLESSKLTPDQIYSVEVVGGSTRIPAIKALISKVFEKDPSTTLNADEAVARGCALQCAMLSPTFKVRDFTVLECCSHSLTLQWKDPTQGESTMEIFPLHHQAPFSKMLTFYRKESFALHAAYTNPAEVAYKNPSVGTFVINGVKESKEGENSKVKVKVRMNINGIFTVSEASMVEKIIEPEPEQAANGETPMETADKPAAEEKPAAEATPMDTANGAATDAPPAADASTNEQASADTNGEASTNGEQMDVDKEGEKPKDDAKAAPEATGEPVVQKPKKKKTRMHNCPVSNSLHLEIDQKTLQEMIDKEAQMVMNDKHEAEKAEAKNNVEEYVYEMRDKVYSKYEQYVAEEERSEFVSLLDNTENWLYEEGEDQRRQVYVDKLAELKKKGDRICRRYTEHLARPGAVEQLGATIQKYNKFLNKFAEGDEAYAHIESAEVDKVKDAVQVVLTWYDTTLQKQIALPQNIDPVVTVAEIKTQHKTLESTCKPIINKPKPKPKAEQPPADTAAPAAETKVPDATETPAADAPTANAAKEAEDMDLD